MPVRYPSHLYIRVDRPLRADLLHAAGAAGQSVSAFARGLLRANVARTLHPTAEITIAASAAAARPGDEGTLIFRGTVRQSKTGAGR